MGGGSATTATPLTSTPDDEFLVENDDSLLSSMSFHSSYHQYPRVDLGEKVEDVTLNENNESVADGFEKVGQRVSPSDLDFDAKKKKRITAYREILQSYDQMRIRSASLEEAKAKILGYKPGRWIESEAAVKLSDYNVPKSTTLLLVGPKGSGKSSLVNRISRVFEDKFASERAQVSYNSLAGDGTYFFQEYMIPRGSTSFCLFDTRGLSDDASDNVKMLKIWITKGVDNGKVIIRPSDNSSLKKRLQNKARKYDSKLNTRMVNFVIFVVDGVEVLKSIGNIDNGAQCTELIAESFNCPYLSFKDDKPAVVVTHGDLLSLADRARIRVYLGELLGIPPAKQIFDIPESCDPVTELTIIDMLRYSLEHADKNIPHKDWLAKKVPSVSLSACISFLIILTIAILSTYILTPKSPKSYKKILHRFDKSVHVDWGSIRHLWLG